MCISTTPRPAPAHRPAIDAAHLLSHVNVKTEYAAQQTPLQSYQEMSSNLEPKPIAETSSSTEQQDDTLASRKQNPHIVVQHHYHDHSHDNRADYQEEHPARGGVTTPFPLKLHEMLENVAGDGFDHVVSWQPHGRCFVVHKPKEFVDLLPTYFKLSKLASFQRQLNLYGFQRLTRGRDRGGYYHELFLQGKVFLAHSIQRIKVKGTGVRARSNPDQEPDFWTMPWVTGDDSNKMNRGNVAMPPQAQTAVIKQAPPQQLYQPSNNFANLMPQMAPLFRNKMEEDLVCAFGNKTFHYLDPFQPSIEQQQQQQASRPRVGGVDELLSTEAESFFHDFEFPEHIGTEIEDDGFFGDMLEQMIA